MKKLFSAFKNPDFLKVFLPVLFSIIFLAGIVYIQKTQSRVSIEDSQVMAPIIGIAPSTMGKLSEVNVYEGEYVKKGDTLATVGSETLHTETDALVTLVNNQVGGVVSPQVHVIEMIQPTEMRVMGTIDENKGLNEIKVGQVVSFTVDALPGKTFWGYVDEVSPTAKQTQASFSISSERPTQQFLVYARFDALKYPEIKNGMSAKMTVFTKSP